MDVSVLLTNELSYETNKKYNRYTGGLVVLHGL